MTNNQTFAVAAMSHHWYTCDVSLCGRTGLLDVLNLTKLLQLQFYSAYLAILTIANSHQLSAVV